MRLYICCVPSSRASLARAGGKWGPLHTRVLQNVLKVLLDAIKHGSVLAAQGTSAGRRMSLRRAC